MFLADIFVAIVIVLGGAQLCTFWVATIFHRVLTRRKRVQYYKKSL